MHTNTHRVHDDDCGCAFTPERPVGDAAATGEDWNATIIAGTSSHAASECFAAIVRIGLDESDEPRRRLFIFSYETVDDAIEAAADCARRELAGEAKCRG
jgi:hypothetical protein